MARHPLTPRPPRLEPVRRRRGRAARHRQPPVPGVGHRLSGGGGRRVRHRQSVEGPGRTRPSAGGPLRRLFRLLPEWPPDHGDDPRRAAPAHAGGDVALHPARACDAGSRCRGRRPRRGPPDPLRGALALRRDRRGAHRRLDRARRGMGDRPRGLAPSVPELPVGPRSGRRRDPRGDRPDAPRHGQGPRLVVASRGGRRRRRPRRVELHARHPVRPRGHPARPGRPTTAPTRPGRRGVGRRTGVVALATRRSGPARHGRSRTRGARVAPVRAHDRPGHDGGRPRSRGAPLAELAASPTARRDRGPGRCHAGGARHLLGRRVDRLRLDLRPDPPRQRGRTGRRRQSGMGVARQPRRGDHQCHRSPRRRSHGASPGHARRRDLALAGADADGGRRRALRHRWSPTGRDVRVRDRGRRPTRPGAGPGDVPDSCGGAGVVPARRRVLRAGRLQRCGVRRDGGGGSTALPGARRPALRQHLRERRRRLPGGLRPDADPARPGGPVPRRARLLRLGRSRLRPQRFRCRVAEPRRGP